MRELSFAPIFDSSPVPKLEAVAQKFGPCKICSFTTDDDEAWDRHTTNASCFVEKPETYEKDQPYFERNQKE